jgi:hypothetical protein
MSTVTVKPTLSPSARMYKIPKANAVAMPLDPNVAYRRKIQKKEEKKRHDERLSGGYANAIRALMYVAIGTRPDISPAVQTLRKFTKDPGPTHWSALKRDFEYLAGTRGMAARRFRDLEHRLSGCWLCRRY